MFRVLIHLLLNKKPPGMLIQIFLPMVACFLRIIPIRIKQRKLLNMEFRPNFFPFFFLWLFRVFQMKNDHNYTQIYSVLLGEL